MKSVTGKEFARVLERHGWTLKRIKGSHHIYAKDGRIERISVPVHAGKPLKAGILNYLLKTAGLTEEEI